PVAAQDAQTLPSLEELIPDEAVADPEAWAGQGVPPGAAAAEDAPGELDSASPLTDLPEIDLPWPEQQELPQLAPLESEEDIEFAQCGDIFPEQVELAAEERISDELVLVFPRDRALFPYHDDFLDRFESLSTIEELEDDNNAARLAA